MHDTLVLPVRASHVVIQLRGNAQVGEAGVSLLLAHADADEAERKSS